MTSPRLFRGKPPPPSPWRKHRHRWQLESFVASLPRPTPDPTTSVVAGTCECGATTEFLGAVDRDWQAWRVASRFSQQSLRAIAKGVLLRPRIVLLHVAAFAVTWLTLARAAVLDRGSVPVLFFLAWALVLVLNVALLVVRSLVSGSPESHPPPPVEGGIVMTGSISSTVKLDYDAGTAEKIYLPTRFVRLLYRLAFQGRFPYADNAPALEAARLRRTVAGLLTEAWFGENLVAQVLSVRPEDDGRFTFVTELVRGTEPKDPPHAKLLLRQLTERFLDAGLASWQVAYYNPRALGNLIERPDGSYRIIDLESNLVTPFMPLGAAMRAIRQAQYPSFDDIDMPRLDDYLATNHDELVAVLGPEKSAELLDAASRYGYAQREWHGSELRLAGKILRAALSLVDVPRWIRAVRSRSAGSP